MRITCLFREYTLCNHCYWIEHLHYRHFRDEWVRSGHIISEAECYRHIRNRDECIRHVGSKREHNRHAEDRERHNRGEEEHNRDEEEHNRGEEEHCQSQEQQHIHDTSVTCVLAMWNYILNCINQ